MFLLLLLFGTLWAQTAPPSAVMNSGAAVYQINVSQRGQDIVSMFKTLNTTFKTSLSEIGIQTAIPITNSVNKAKTTFIPYVVDITAMSNNTILLIKQQEGNTFYYVVPVEQVVELIYYQQQPIPANGGYNSQVTNGILPLLIMDEAQRAADLKQIFDKLNTEAPFSTATSKVAFQTTLTGNYYPSVIGGFIPYIQKVELQYTTNKTYMLITYKVGVQTSQIVVAPDQVYAVIYTQY
jgi:hypothetical protein